MSAVHGQAVDLQQASQLWSMLDEMSDNDPESYRTFIHRQLKESAEFCAPPQAYACIRTVVQEPKEGLLYINLCSWKRIPAPKGHSQPVPVVGGRLETLSDDSETYSVVDVAFNPSVLQGAQESPQERDQLHLLALSFIQQQHGLRLSQDYTLLSGRLKGTAQSMRLRLASKRQDTLSAPAPKSPSGSSLLQQISSLRGEQGESEDSPPIQLTPQNRTGPAKPALIQVISSTESAQPRRPRHQLSTATDADGTAKTVQLTVELPGVRSMSECQLSLSQDDVLLEVGDTYHLHLELPEAVREEEASAVFNRKKRTLSVTMPVL
ncbi:PIH1 domain-containing protein 2 [Anguilla anguilla]|uniref:PIH1 domain-containing protein 2 n=1 Tax=Anguilla anguilla TaxID=7936 RepID=UPI0015B1F4E9|nr:PIH1 domain-containing protein 2 [Anguilla anguilla]